jgi:hypothetical protein
MKTKTVATIGALFFLCALNAMLFWLAAGAEHSNWPYRLLYPTPPWWLLVILNASWIAAVVLP